MKPYQSLPELMARGRVPDEKRTTTPVPPAARSDPRTEDRPQFSFGRRRRRQTGAAALDAGTQCHPPRQDVDCALGLETKPPAPTQQTRAGQEINLQPDRSA